MPRERKRACCVCGVAKTNWRCVRLDVVGKRLKKCVRVSATVKNELLVATRLAAIDDATVIRANDVVCRMCQAHGWSLTESMADQLWSSHATQDARRIQLLLKHADEHFEGRLPKYTVKIQVPGWAEPGEEAAAFEARKWIYKLLDRGERADPKMPTRLEAVKALGPEQAEWATELQTRVEAQKKADLAAQAQTDARRIQLLLKYVDEHCEGRLPKRRVKIKVPGWAEPGEKAAAFDARQWIYEVLERGERANPKTPTRLEAVKALGPEQATWAKQLQTRVEAVAPLTRMTTPCELCDAEETSQWYSGPRAGTRICVKCYCQRRNAEKKRSAPASKRAPRKPSKKRKATADVTSSYYSSTLVHTKKTIRT